VKKQAVKKEKKIAKAGRKAVTKAAGLKAAKKTLLARRRSANTRLTRMLGKMESPKKILGRRRAVPRAFRALKKKKGSGINRLKRKLARLLKPVANVKDIKRKDKARKAQVAKKYAKSNPNCSSRRQSGLPFARQQQNGRSGKPKPSFAKSLSNRPWPSWQVQSERRCCCACRVSLRRQKA